MFIKRMPRYLFIGIPWQAIQDGVIRVRHQVCCFVNNYRTIAYGSDCEFCGDIAVFEGSIWTMERDFDGEQLQENITLFGGAKFCWSCKGKGESIEAWMALKACCLLNNDEWKELKTKIGPNTNWKDDLYLLLDNGTPNEVVTSTNFDTMIRRYHSGINLNILSVLPSIVPHLPHPITNWNDTVQVDNTPVQSIKEPGASISFPEWHFMKEIVETVDSLMDDQK